MEAVIDWMMKSGLKINMEKTEICIFHRRNKITKCIELKNICINTINTMSILGVRFDSGLKLNIHIEKAIKEANMSLNGIKMIKKYFTPDETKNLITAVCYSKLYYGSEIWHLPGVSNTLHKKIISSSIYLFSTSPPQNKIICVSK